MRRLKIQNFLLRRKPWLRLSYTLTAIQYPKKNTKIRSYMSNCEAQKKQGSNVLNPNFIFQQLSSFHPTYKQTNRKGFFLGGGVLKFFLRGGVRKFFAHVEGRVRNFFSIFGNILHPPLVDTL